MDELLKIVDIGTSKISILVGKFDGQKIDIIFISSYPSSGIKKGKVVDMESLTNSLKRAIGDCEGKLNIKIKKAALCYSGVDIKGTHSSGTIRIRKKMITEEDVNFAIDSASAMVIPQDREVIHVLPVEFIVDENTGIRDPIGMRGLRLEAKVYVVTAASNQIQNILTCCNKAGFDVEEVILQGVASSEAVLSQHDKDLGCLVIDVGAGTTDVSIFSDGYIKYLSNFGIAGNHITNDLAIGLKISHTEAERIKKQFGNAIPKINFLSAGSKLRENHMIMEDLNLPHGTAEIEIIGTDRNPVKIPYSVINEIVNARCEEIIDIIKNEISSLQEEINISSAILTGGTSLLQGFAPLAESLLSLPVRIGRPDAGLVSLFSEMGWDDSLVYENEILANCFSPEYSSLIGAYIYRTREQLYNETSTDLEKIFEKVKKWINSLINK